jgi:hypothetical protein
MNNYIFTCKNDILYFISGDPEVGEEEYQDRKEEKQW